MNKKKPRWMTDKSYYGHPDCHLPVLVIASIVLVIAAVVFFFTFSIARDWLTAKYKEEVTATLTEIREGEEERWEYIESAQEVRTPNERETRTYTQTIYTLDWEYEINGEKHIWNTTETSLTAHQIGDTMVMRFFSLDGEEYHRSNHSAVSIFLMWISVAAAAAALYLILRIVYIKIRIRSKKKKKRR